MEIWFSTYDETGSHAFKAIPTLGIGEQSAIIANLSLIRN